MTPSGSQRGPAIGLLLASTLLAACGASPQYVDRSVPMGSDTELESIHDVPVAGHTVSVQYRAIQRSEPRGPLMKAGTRLGESQCGLSGELLAVEPGYLWLRLQDEDEIELLGSKLVRVHAAAIEELKIQLHDSKGTLLAVLTTVGSLSTASHGLLAIFSLPTWLGTGITSSVVNSQGAQLHLEGARGVYLYQFARFPQGLPQSFREREPVTASCRR